MKARIKTSLKCSPDTKAKTKTMDIVTQSMVNPCQTNA